jgi:hypothetical protein
MKIGLILILLMMSSCSTGVDFHQCLEHHHGARAASECHTPHHGGEQ